MWKAFQGENGWYVAYEVGGAWHRPPPADYYPLTRDAALTYAALRNHMDDVEPLDDHA